VFHSPFFYIWITWLILLLVFAVVRLVIGRRTQRKRTQRRVERLARPTGSAVRNRAGRPPAPPNYREQLITAGIIQPAPDPASADPSV
jgi:hypothetical protein